MFNFLYKKTYVSSVFRDYLITYSNQSIRKMMDLYNTTDNLIKIKYDFNESTTDDTKNNSSLIHYTPILPSWVAFLSVCTFYYYYNKK